MQFRCALWSDGSLDLVRERVAVEPNGDRRVWQEGLMQLSVDEAKQLVHYLERLAKSA